MKVLIVGRHGQLAHELQKQVPSGVSLLIPERSELDLAHGIECYEYIKTQKPDWVINAGAYTNVDQAEIDSNLAYEINAVGPTALAWALKETGGKLIYVSTDYVFGGNKLSAYEITDDHEPKNSYGFSKSIGEYNIASVLDADQYAVIRTSWVYSSVSKNFVLTLLKGFKEYKTFSVVVDQYGCPTSAKSLAAACWAVVDNDLSGVFHWTDGSAMSWADFADAVAEEAFNMKLIDYRPIITRVGTKDYPTQAVRPKYSVLNCVDSYERLKLDKPHWLNNLREVLGELLEA